MNDWELKHKELCKKDAEERKVKGNREERTTSEKENLEKISGKLTHMMMLSLCLLERKTIVGLHNTR